MSDKTIIEEWFKYSFSDLFTAYHMFYDVYPKEIEIVCYHSQQCAEKALKGYLISKDTEPPHSHNLVELCQLCMQYDNSFSGILDDCSDLTPYGVVVRYPNELAVDEAIAEIAFNKAKKVYEHCVSQIPLLQKHELPTKNQMEDDEQS